MSCMTSFLPLLHPGAEDASALEKAADWLLTYPNSLWHGRKVIPVIHDDKWEVTYESTACFGSGDLLCCIKPPGVQFMENRQVMKMNPTGDICGFVLLGAIPYFTLIELPALFCSAVGIPLKNCAIQNSEKSNAYNKLMESYLIHEEFLAQKKIIEDEIVENTQLVEFEGELLKVSEQSKAVLQQVQTKFKGVKESQEISALVQKIDSKQKNYNSFLNKSERLKRELDFFNQKITDCEQKIAAEKQAYENAID